MALHYINWMHVKAHLDKVAFNETEETLSIDEVNLKAEEAEAKFDSRFSRRFDLPVTLAAEPEMFVVVQTVVSMWAAAEYIRLARQTPASREQLWYADQLEKQADDRVDMLQVRRQPEDAPMATDPVVEIPTDGRTATNTDNPPIFILDQIKAGNTAHW